MSSILSSRGTIQRLVLPIQFRKYSSAQTQTPERNTRIKKPRREWKYRDLNAQDAKILMWGSDGKTRLSPPIPPPNDIQFGSVFSHHMITVKHIEGKGWQRPVIGPFRNMSLSPAAMVLHYAGTVFEGMKAYRSTNNPEQISLFRPDMNMARMNDSSRRAALPGFSSDALLSLIKQLVRIDSKFVPHGEGNSLYIRPFHFASEPHVGIRAPKETTLCVITCPVGSYYKNGFKPVSLLATSDAVRAWPGGSGAFKMGSNYAACVKPQMSAAEQGYDQNLWLFGDDMLTEVGSMNLFVLLASGKDSNVQWELITPPLNGTILPGITRDSILTLARQHEEGKIQIEGIPSNFKVSEREIGMKELVEAESQGRLLEVFGSGTAAVIAPVDKIGYNGRDIILPAHTAGAGEAASAFLREIVRRQRGVVPSDWCVSIDS